jgi:hypothetical protein
VTCGGEGEFWEGGTGSHVDVVRIVVVLWCVHKVLWQTFRRFGRTYCAYLQSDWVVHLLGPAVVGYQQLFSCWVGQLLGTSSSVVGSGSCWVSANVKAEEPKRRPSLKLSKRDWRKLRKEEDQDLYCSNYRGPDSSVSIAPRYGLDGPRIESRYGTIFRPLSSPALRPTQPPMRCIMFHSRG